MNLGLITFASLMIFGSVARAEFVADPAPTAELKPFFTDGCTGFVDGPPGRSKLWHHCCFEHDLRYWFGGQESDMDFADRELRACVKDVAGSGWAKVIYKGVRVGHSSPIKSKTHWSWGWTPSRRKSPLTRTEVEMVEMELRALDLEPAYVDGFITKYLRK